ncbi:MAG: hypothetical protein Q7S33_00760 [Nanoarchaeota archaeon]|nr:hypothetical protein [Nanoarchaeota archaeon]
MEKLESFIGPGTAGLTQRIPAKYEGTAKTERLYVVEYNRVISCSQNQY